MQTITLNFPLVINGENIKTISYDFGKFSTQDYFAALNSRKGSSIENAVNPVNDYSLHYAIGVRALLASNKDRNWTAEDFDRLCGSDLWQVTAVGLNFFGATPEVPRESSSGGPSEPTRKDSTPPAGS